VQTSEALKRRIQSAQDLLGVVKTMKALAAVSIRQYQKAVEMVPEYRWGWSYISHFIHSRFYCYSYIFGELVVLTLYEKYLEEGETFIPGFVRLLESGGSASPDVLLARLGLDINRADFWERGFKVIRNLIDELKSLGPWEKICVRENP